MPHRACDGAGGLRDEREPARAAVPRARAVAPARGVRAARRDPQERARHPEGRGDQGFHPHRRMSAASAVEHIILTLVLDECEGGEIHRIADAVSLPNGPDYGRYL